jgi:hypothetical protein
MHLFFFVNFPRLMDNINKMLRLFINRKHINSFKKSIICKFDQICRRENQYMNKYMRY